MDLVSFTNNIIPIHWTQHFKGRLSIQRGGGGFLQSHCIGIRAKFIQLLFYVCYHMLNDAINSVENENLFLLKVKTKCYNLF